VTRRDMAQAADKISPQFVLGWLKEKLKKKGLRGVADFAISFISDYWFDLRYGTSTSGWIPRNKLITRSNNIHHSGRYQATKVRPFRKLMKLLSFPENSILIDVGCGKGKVLMMASEYGFKKILGVEFSPDLCAIARNNIDVYRKRRSGPVADIEVVESDIIDYDLRGEENVFYLYNPFDDVILGRLIKNIEQSVKKRPRKIWLIYHTPRYTDIIEREKFFTRGCKYYLGGTEFVVYEMNTLEPSDLFVRNG
jgi:SAM-dependent methyltransferase